MKSGGDTTARRGYRMGARQASVEETRDRICAATSALWLELPYDDITLDAVAEHAGTTRQTIIRHFGSKEQLIKAAADWYTPIADAAVEAEPGDVEGAIDHLLAQREVMGDANVRMLELEDRIEAIRYGLDQGRAHHRAWVERTFAPQLAPIRGRTKRQHAIDALYAATDVTIWKLLRRDFNRSLPATRAVMLSLVNGVIATFAGTTHGGT